MYFESLQAAIEMDGHGAFVWSAFGLSVIVLALTLLLPLRRERRLLAELRGELRRQGRRPSPAAEGA